jgi:hypothetical protein
MYSGKHGDGDDEVVWLVDATAPGRATVERISDGDSGERVVPGDVSPDAAFACARFWRGSRRDAEGSAHARRIAYNRAMLRVCALWPTMLVLIAGTIGEARA